VDDILEAHMPPHCLESDFIMSGRKVPTNEEILAQSAEEPYGGKASPKNSPFDKDGPSYRGGR